MLVDVNAAKTRLLELIEQAHAGQEIILTKAGAPYARMMPLAHPAPKRIRGRVKGIDDRAFFDASPDDRR
jgi:prevent-host-death family protein